MIRLFLGRSSLFVKRVYCLLIGWNLWLGTLIEVDWPFFITNMFPHRTLEIKSKCTNKVFKFNGKFLNFFHKSSTPLEDVTIEEFSLENPTYFAVYTGNYFFYLTLMLYFSYFIFVFVLLRKIYDLRVGRVISFRIFFL